MLNEYYSLLNEKDGSINGKDGRINERMDNLLTKKGISNIIREISEIDTKFV